MHEAAQEGARPAQQNARLASGPLIIASLALMAIIVAACVLLGAWRSRSRAADAAYYKSPYCPNWTLPSDRIQAVGCSAAEDIVNQIRSMDFSPGASDGYGNLQIELANGQALRVLCSERNFAVQLVVLIRDQKHPENTIAYSAYQESRVGVSTEGVVELMHSAVQEIDEQARAYWNEVSTTALRELDR